MLAVIESLDSRFRGNERVENHKTLMRLAYFSDPLVARVCATDSIASTMA